jgi:hypothetical protein
MECEVSFGAWVTKRRKALDLTREQLARRVGYSVSALPGSGRPAPDLCASRPRPTARGTAGCRDAHAGGGLGARL